MMLYICLLRRYVDYLNRNYVTNDPFYTVRESKELLRHSVCVGLGLPSAAASDRVAMEAPKVAEYMFADVDTSVWSLKYKQGVLEACLKCCEKVMKGA